MIEQHGEMNIEHCNDANIPVVCFLAKPGDNDEYKDKWVWSASNFMPRIGHCAGGAYVVTADTQEELLGLIGRYVVPLYDNALRQIVSGELYYWSSPKTGDKERLEAGAELVSLLRDVRAECPNHQGVVWMRIDKAIKEHVP